MLFVWLRQIDRTVLLCWYKVCVMTLGLSICALFRIAAICKPHVFVDHVSSDWTLLKRIRTGLPTPNRNFYLESNYVDVMSFLGWNGAACDVVDAAAAAASNHRSGGHAAKINSKSKPRNDVDNIGKGVCSSLPMLLSREHLLWAAVVVVGSVVSYSMYHNG